MSDKMLGLAFRDVTGRGYASQPTEIFKLIVMEGPPNYELQVSFKLRLGSWLIGPFSQKWAIVTAP